MWEAIEINRRKSAVLIFAQGLVMAMLGIVIGYYLFPSNPSQGMFFGIVIAMIIWIVLLLSSFLGGEQILLATAGAKEIKKSDSPRLFNVVEEMKIASGLPAMPRVFIIDSHVPNAFAVGLKPERAAVAVTTGLMAKLNRDELQGVVAHEIGHIANRDTMFMTIAGVTVGAVIIIADLFLRGLIYSGGGNRRRSSQGGGQLALVLAIASITFAIISPLLAQILYFAASRKREYLADASAVQYTRFPEGLASALEKISAGQSKKFSKSRTLAPMFIVNPMAASGIGGGLFSTHPPTQDRIFLLRSMSGSSSLRTYEQTFRKLHGGVGVISPDNLKFSKEVPIRKAGTLPEEHNPKKNLRDIKNVLHKSAGYGLLSCECGVRLKIPPNFKHKRIRCPRCGRPYQLSAELLATVFAIGTAPKQNRNTLLT
jgi:heat shock protein HtpX